MAWKEIKRTFVDLYHATIAPQKKSITSYSYVKEIAGATVIVLVVVAAFWGYRSYNSHQEESAQIELAKVIQSYQEALQRGAIAWPQVEILVQTSYEQYKQSRVAPYFLVYQAEVQIQQNKLKEAIATLENAIAAFPKDSPFINLYKTKLALMRLDEAAAQGAQLNLDELSGLAYDKANAYNDYASYYLGLFTWNKGNKEEAQKIWKELVESQRHEQRLAQSPWVELAKEKLAQSGDIKE